MRKLHPKASDLIVYYTLESIKEQTFCLGRREKTQFAFALLVILVTLGTHTDTLVCLCVCVCVCVCVNGPVHVC